MIVNRCAAIVTLVANSIMRLQQGRMLVLIARGFPPRPTAPQLQDAASFHNCSMCSLSFTHLAVLCGTSFFAQCLGSHLLHLERRDF